MSWVRIVPGDVLENPVLLPLSRRSSRRVLTSNRSQGALTPFFSVHWEVLECPLPESKEADHPGVDCGDDDHLLSGFHHGEGIHLVRLRGGLRALGSTAEM